MHRPAVLLLAAALGLSPADPAPTAGSAALRAAMEATLGREAEALKAIAGPLGGEVAAEIEGFLPPPPASDGSSRFVPLPEIVPKAEPVTPVEVRKAREAAGADLFDIASKALRADPPHLALADECLRATVARLPDHAEARRLLGYVPHEGGWATSFAVKKLADGFRPHPTYGWVESSWVEHLERGELPAPYVAGRPVRWMPADEADALRRGFNPGWTITTEHFTIRTNVPLSEVIAFGQRLEAMHELFYALLADFVGAEHPLQALARDPKLAPPLPKRTHRVFYFADKEDYVRFLLPLQGEGVRDSLGTYLPVKEARRLGLTGGHSLFFRDPGGQLDATETLYHEVSHQLMFESGVTNRYDESRAHFWVYEGLGTYFETLRPQPDGSIRVGGLVGRRIEVARERLVGAREFIPIGRLSTFNKYLFNGANGNDVYLNYAEAMALAVFFMQAHHARYRERFVEYARDVYRGKVRAGEGKSIEERIDEPPGTLDRDVVSYLRSGPSRPTAAGASGE